MQHPTDAAAHADAEAWPTLPDELRAVGDASGDRRRAVSRRWHDEDGSMVSEYGLVAVLGATIAGLAIVWARGGAIARLLTAVMEQVQSVIGA